ncbi:MAG: D-isomer specific 2-hydroxyacid dehydrogenase, partial [Acidobacteriaceae bacterium]|nr:D-isomer specific 2-hydroxyacid dehydrogenase [Acidobacteriaceae bacterium]
APSLFEGSTIQFVQVTGAGLDRLDEPTLKRGGIAVSNVPGGSSSALAEYAVTTTSLLLRRFAWADDEIRKGNYAEFRNRMLRDNLAGLENLLSELSAWAQLVWQLPKHFIKWAAAFATTIRHRAIRT